MSLNTTTQLIDKTPDLFILDDDYIVIETHTLIELLRLTDDMTRDAQHNRFGMCTDFILIPDSGITIMITIDVLDHTQLFDLLVNGKYDSSPNTLFDLASRVTDIIYSAQFNL